MPVKLTGYQIFMLSCGCRTRVLTPPTSVTSEYEPFSGTFKVKCPAHEKYKTPADLKRGCIPYLPEGAVYAECPIDFGGEKYEPEG